MHPLVLYTLAIVTGLCVGSFVNVVIHRLPGMVDSRYASRDGSPSDTVPNLFSPPSCCPACRTPLRVRDNVPVISFLLLRGRCAHCGKPISRRYPIVEVLGAIIALFLVSTLDAPLAVFGAAVFSFALLALLFIDLEHYLLPDLVTLPLMWCGLLINIGGTFIDLPSAVIGAATGYLLLWSVFHLFRLVTGKEGLGYGDFKLVAAIGAWLGWQMLPLVILLASVVGAAVGAVYLAASRRGRDHPIPFGPFLAGAGWLAMFWGDTILSTYFQLAGLD